MRLASYGFNVVQSYQLMTDPQVTYYLNEVRLAGITGASAAANVTLTFALDPDVVLVFDLWPQGADISIKPLSAATPGTFGAWAASQNPSKSSEEEGDEGESDYGER